MTKALQTRTPLTLPGPEFDEGTRDGERHVGGLHAHGMKEHSLEEEMHKSHHKRNQSRP